jgi:hypothetical protein
MGRTQATVVAASTAAPAEASNQGTFLWDIKRCATGNATKMTENMFAWRKPIAREHITQVKRNAGALVLARKLNQASTNKKNTDGTSLSAASLKLQNKGLARNIREPNVAILKLVWSLRIRNSGMTENEPRIALSNVKARWGFFIIESRSHPRNM